MKTKLSHSSADAKRKKAWKRLIELMNEDVKWGISFWDALIVSSANRYKILTIYTENTKDFEKIPGIKAINPLK